MGAVIVMLGVVAGEKCKNGCCCYHHFNFDEFVQWSSEHPIIVIIVTLAFSLSFIFSLGSALGQDI